MLGSIMPRWPSFNYGYYYFWYRNYPYNMVLGLTEWAHKRSYGVLYNHANQYWNNIKLPFGYYDVGVAEGAEPGIATTMVAG